MPLRPQLPTGLVIQRILRGIPFLKAAKALGLTIPKSFLLRAD